MRSSNVVLIDGNKTHVNKTSTSTRVKLIKLIATDSATETVRLHWHRPVSHESLKHCKYKHAIHTTYSRRQATCCNNHSHRHTDTFNPECITASSSTV